MLVEKNNSDHYSDLNGVLFVSPFVLHRYEVMRAVERNATGFGAMPFAWFALVCMLSIAYVIAIIILLITAEIGKKKDRTAKK